VRASLALSKLLDDTLWMRSLPPARQVELRGSGKCVSVRIEARCALSGAEIIGRPVVLRVERRLHLRDRHPANGIDYIITWIHRCIPICRALPRLSRRKASAQCLSSHVIVVTPLQHTIGQRKLGSHTLSLGELLCAPLTNCHPRQIGLLTEKRHNLRPYLHCVTSQKVTACLELDQSRTGNPFRHLTRDGKRPV
jgi:hypothetical protein